MWWLWFGGGGGGQSEKEMVRKAKAAGGFGRRERKATRQTEKKLNPLTGPRCRQGEQQVSSPYVCPGVVLFLDGDAVSWWFSPSLMFRAKRNGRRRLLQVQKKKRFNPQSEFKQQRRNKLPQA